MCNLTILTVGGCGLCVGLADGVVGLVGKLKDWLMAGETRPGVYFMLRIRGDSP